MLHHIVPSPVAKRVIEAASKLQHLELPWWTWIVVLVNVAIFLPIFLIISYTVEQVFPVLAIVEDQNPSPAYSHVSLNVGDEESASTTKPTPDPTVAGKPVTSSMRAMRKLLTANSGTRGRFASYFHGAACLVATQVATWSLVRIFQAAFTGILSWVAILLARLAVVKLSAAWVHIVITPSRPNQAFWKRLPPFKKTLRATALPTFVHIVACEISSALPFVLGTIFGVPIPKADDDVHRPGYEPSKQLSLLALFGLISIVAYILLSIPAHIVLIRVQASLLPIEDEAIVSFDRSFGGRVEPAAAGGKGYATIKDVWASLGLEAWRRLAALYAKIFLLTLVTSIVIVLVVAPQALLIAAAASSIVVVDTLNSLGLQ